MRDIAVPLSQHFVCRCLRDAILSRHINAFDKYVLRIEGQFASFQAQRVCVSWFGTIKFLGVVAVLNCHELPTRTMCDPDTIT